MITDMKMDMALNMTSDITFGKTMDMTWNIISDLALGIALSITSDFLHFRKDIGYWGVLFSTNIKE